MTVQRQLAVQTWNWPYQLTLKPLTLEDFEPCCQWQQTAPDYHFAQQRIRTLPTKDGRIALSDLKLIRTEQGKSEVRLLQDEDEWRATLAEHFGVRL